MSKSQAKNKVGELRPSQILFFSGVGSVIDLPNLSTMVTGSFANKENEAPGVGVQGLNCWTASALYQPLMPSANDFLHSVSAPGQLPHRPNLDRRRDRYRSTCL